MFRLVWWSFAESLRSPARRLPAWTGSSPGARTSWGKSIWWDRAWSAKTCPARDAPRDMASQRWRKFWGWIWLRRSRNGDERCDLESNGCPQERGGLRAVVGGGSRASGPPHKLG